MTMISDADAARYDDIYMKGGHDICFDFPKSRELASVAAKLYESGKIGSAVCQGLAGLLEVKLSKGEYLVAGIQPKSKWPERGSNPHVPIGTQDFKSCASANSAIRPRVNSHALLTNSLQTLAADNRF